MQSDWLLGGMAAHFALANSLELIKNTTLLLKQSSSCLWFVYLKETLERGKPSRRPQKAV